MTDNPVTKVDDTVRLHQRALAIRSRADFVEFVRELAHSLQQSPEGLENRDLPSYLEALAAWVEDMDGYYRNRGETPPEPPGWKAFAQMLLAARVYE